jgi:hypothetical protein
MIFEGNQAVISAIKEKRQLMEEYKTHDHIRPLLICTDLQAAIVWGNGSIVSYERASKRI